MFSNLISRVRNALSSGPLPPALPPVPEAPQPDDVATAMSIVNLRRAHKTPADVYKGLHHVLWELDPARWNARARIYTGTDERILTFWEQKKAYGPITPETKDRDHHFYNPNALVGTLWLIKDLMVELFGADTVANLRSQKGHLPDVLTAIHLVEEHMAGKPLGTFASSCVQTSIPFEGDVFGRVPQQTRPKENILLNAMTFGPAKIIGELAEALVNQRPGLLAPLSAMVENLTRELHIDTEDLSYAHFMKNATSDAERLKALIDVCTGYWGLGTVVPGTNPDDTLRHEMEALGYPAYAGHPDLHIDFIELMLCSIALLLLRLHYGQPLSALPESVQAAGLLVA